MLQLRFYLRCSRFVKQPPSRVTNMTVAFYSTVKAAARPPALKSDFPKHSLPDSAALVTSASYVGTFQVWLSTRPARCLARL